MHSIRTVLMPIDTVTHLLRIVDQLNTEELTGIQTTMELMKMDFMNAEQKLVKRSQKGFLVTAILTL